LTQPSYSEGMTTSLNRQDLLGSSFSRWNNPRMAALISEIARTGTLCQSSLNSVLSNPQQFTEAEFRRLIAALGTASEPSQPRSASGLSSGGAILNSAW
jgi:hypothetical protein